MNPPSPSNQTAEFSNRDLIELSQLDALGLLDDGERQAFERAFKRAPASIQQLVRDGQLRASDLDAWLPDVRPAVSLRQRVLAAVGAAIRSEGRRPEVAGRLTATIARPSAVAPYWRAAAIGSMAAALLLGVVTLKLYGDFQSVNSTLKANAMADVFLKEFGPRFEHALTSDKTQFVQFTPAAGARGSAVMLMDEGAATAQFFAKDLPPVEGGYTLALVDAGGNVVRTIARINTASGRYVEQYAQVRARPGESFVLKAGSRDGAVMKSRNL